MYAELCQTCMVEIFAKTVNNEFKAFSIFSKKAPSMALKSRHLLDYC